MGGGMLVWIINLLKQGDYTEWDAQMPLPDYTTDSIRDGNDFSLCACVCELENKPLRSSKRKETNKTNYVATIPLQQRRHLSVHFPNSLCSSLITTGNSMDLSIILSQGVIIYLIKKEAANPSGYPFIISNVQFNIILLV